MYLFVRSNYLTIFTRQLQDVELKFYLMKRLAVLLLVTVFAGAAFAQDEQKTIAQYKKEGSQAYKAKDFSGAYNAFLNAIELGKQKGELDTSLYYNAAVSAYKSRQVEKSIGYFGKSAKYGIHPKRSYLLKYQLEKKLDRDAAADSTIKHAYEDFPENSKIAYYYNYGHGIDLYKKGADRIKQVSDLKNSKKEADINKYNSEVDKAHETFREALPFLEKAYENKPTKKVAQILSNIYNNLGMKDKAEKMQAKLD
mgnify:CR=1 FL=1